MGTWDHKFPSKGGGSAKPAKDLFEGTTMALPRCYESHPVLKFGKGTLIGGSASYPKYRADVYVSLQSGSTSGRQSDPWEADQKVREVFFAISDMAAPKDAERFKKLIDYVCNQLHEGKTVHVGCIGGHGRTGVVLSAVVAQLKKEKNAIQWVRKHYCEKAVESREQVKFLMDHYGVSKVEGHKEGALGSGTLFGSKGLGGGIVSKALAYGAKLTHAEELVTTIIRPAKATDATKTFKPMASARSLWKPPTP